MKASRRFLIIQVFSPLHFLFFFYYYYFLRLLLASLALCGCVFGFVNKIQMKMPTIIEGHISSDRSNSLTDDADDDALSGQYNRDCRGREKSNDDDDAQERKSFAGCGRCTLFFIKLAHTHTQQGETERACPFWVECSASAIHTHTPPPP